MDRKHKSARESKREAKEEKKQDLLFLLDNTNYTKKDIKKWRKEIDQNCKDGHVTSTKFLELYTFFPYGHALDFCELVFDSFDQENNGYIEFAEFILAIDVLDNVIDVPD